MLIPTLQQAEQLIKQAEGENPGPWVPHSRTAAKAATQIAAHLPEMNPDNAYILGLLHDIGRRAGVFDMHHIIDGYRCMMELGYDDAARICLTHSFPLQDVRSMQQNWDGTTDEADFVGRYLDSVVYDDYDLLIQLCDALALPHGYCLIEKRLVEVSLRRGINAYTIPKWEAFFQIQRSIEQRLGQSIYNYLPGVIENTFRFSSNKIMRRK